jgi:hypothetical protein
VTTVPLAAMSSESRITLLIVGSLGALYSIAMALDYRGMTTSLASSMYRARSKWLWPWGSERSYIAFNRLIGWPLVVVFAALLALGVRG